MHLPLTLCRAHIHTDIRSYACISEECGSLPPSFSTIKQWKIHMYQRHGEGWPRHIHRVKWLCPYCHKDDKKDQKDESFLSEDLLMQHIRETQEDSHPIDLKQSEITRIIVRSRVVSPRSNIECPLCGPSAWKEPNKESTGPPHAEEPNLLDHIIKHLQYFALLSVSWWDADIGSTTGGQEGSAFSDEANGFNSAPGGNSGSTSGSIFESNEFDEAFYRTTLINREEVGQQFLEQWVVKRSEYNRFFDDNEMTQEQRIMNVIETPFEPPYSIGERISNDWKHVRYDWLRRLLDGIYKARNDLEQLKDDTGESQDSEDSDTKDYSDEFADSLLGEMILQGRFYSHSRSFLPVGRLHELMPASTVASLLPELDTTSEKDLDLFDFVLLEAKKLMAICVMCGFAKWELHRVMRRFHQVQFNDCSLPVSEGAMFNAEFALNPFLSSLWSTVKKRSFLQSQWEFSAPVFRTTHNKNEPRTVLEFDSSCILPITWTSDTIYSGAFSRIIHARIHPDHLDSVLTAIGSHRSQRYPRADINVAIKQLFSHKDDQPIFSEAWELECQALFDLGNIKHAHIVLIIAAFTLDGAHHIMLEWADGGNLLDLWRQLHTKPALSATYMREVLEQLRGLADALCVLHELGYRHGDLKPENILRFPVQDTYVGTLKLCDMGLARRHEVETENRLAATSTRYGTLRYEAPEAVTKYPRSRLYDIWSFGCILMEWMVCLLYGRSELTRFRNDLQPGTFYQIQGRVIIDPSVTRWLDHMANDFECNGNTAMRELLILVRTKLLVIPLRSESMSPSGPAAKITVPTMVIGGSDSPPRSSHTSFRATAVDLKDTLDAILFKAQDNERYLFSGRDRTSSLGPPSHDSIYPTRLSQAPQLEKDENLSSGNNETVRVNSECSSLVDMLTMILGETRRLGYCNKKTKRLKYALTAYHQIVEMGQHEDVGKFRF
jgi:serine/threonine protein kinase